MIKVWVLKNPYHLPSTTTDVLLFAPNLFYQYFDHQL